MARKILIIDDDKDLAFITGDMAMKSRLFQIAKKPLKSLQTGSFISFFWISIFRMVPVLKSVRNCGAHRKSRLYLPVQEPVKMIKLQGLIWVGTIILPSLIL